MDRFGDYLVIGSLGQGAMGVVMRVRHATLGVERALKLLSQVTPERLLRFEREGRTLAEIRHPNVVAVHETGVHDGRPWFVMDLVEGRPLDDLLHTSGRLPVAQVLSIGAGLARGLGALHAAGVVHRDLKPSNVLVRTDGSPVIVDLGVALSPESEGDRLTRTGALVGTLSYMAPEQLAGGRATAASDVYALGSILYEAACGRPSAPEAPSLQEFIARVVDGPTPRVGDVDPTLPAALDRVLVRAMAKGATGRPSALDLATALESPDLTASGPARARGRRLGAVVLVAAATLATAGVAAALVARPTPLAPAALALPPTQTPAPVASSTPVVDAAAVTRALARALGNPAPLKRRGLLAAWLRANPGEPRAAAALEAWRATLREAPLAVWTVAPGKRVCGVFLADGRAFAWVQLESGTWLGDPWTGVGAVVDEHLEAPFVEHDPRGGTLIGDDDGDLYRLAPGSSNLVLERERDGPARGLAVTDRHVAIVRTKVVSVIERDKGRAVKVGNFDNPRLVALAEDGRVAMVATNATVEGDPSWLLAVEVRGGKKLVNQPMGARISVLLPAPDGRVLVAMTSGIVLLLDPRTGEERGRFVSQDVQRLSMGADHDTLAHDAAVRAAVFVDGGRHLLSVGGNIGGAHGDLRCWDVATGRELAPPLRFAAACLRVDAARDERTILVSLDSGALEVWAAPDRLADLDVDRAAR